MSERLSVRALSFLLCSAALFLPPAGQKTALSPAHGRWLKEEVVYIIGDKESPCSSPWNWRGIATSLSRNFGNSAGFAPWWGKSQSRETVLADLLAKASLTCQRLEAASLDFVCREKIVERIYYVMPEKAYLKPGLTRNYIQRVDRLNSFEYDYQLKRFGEGRTERRTLLRENGRKKIEPQAELKTQTFQNRFVIFGPTGLIGGAAQQRYVYRHVRDEEIGGERCAVLEATPRSDMPRDRLDGKIWISPRDGGIRRIQWRPESIGNYELLRRTGELLGATPRLTFVSEYGHEYRGLRFPSLVTVKEEYLQPRYRPLLFSETEVRYAAYRFFTVETEAVLTDEIRSR